MSRNQKPAGGSGSSGASSGGYGGGQSKYQKQMKGGKAPASTRLQGQSERVHSGRKENVDRAQIRTDGDEIDLKFGFERMKNGVPDRMGWLLNYLVTSMNDESGNEKSALDLYFVDREGGNFKATVFYDPYFYVDLSDPRRFLELHAHLPKRLEGCKVDIIDLEDLDLPNHLSGKRHKFLKLSFGTVAEMMDAKNILRPIIQTNQKRDQNDEEVLDDDEEQGGHGGHSSGGGSLKASSDPISFISEMREHDVSYDMRVAIDLDLRVGSWHLVSCVAGSEACVVTRQHDLLELCEPKVLAFDIECEKAPLKFPNAENDRIYMISYMLPGQGYLIINREVVSEDVSDFEYTPLPKYPGPFVVMNEPNEEAMLRKFLSHIQELRPHVIVTYNGDFFDWPYLDTRCSKYANMSLYKQLGIRSSSPPGAGGANAGMSKTESEYTGRGLVHLDAFCWVKRDSYLPQGNQGLKAVTKSKLGYDPVEVDPEDMLRFAIERPTHMASYSVSDAVATYYLYASYVHHFIFSLSTVIPMGPEDVLRKGSGTLCESLLMVQAKEGNIVCPNKQSDPLESFHNGHLLESETYIGGHVECLEAGVFRADIPAKFTLVPSALQQLIDHVDRDLTFAIEVENGMQRTDCVNYDQVRQAIVSQLEMLRDAPLREEPAVIYHLDVGAMYPNIILTNRLQPSAIVSAHDCAACVFNRADSQCKRPMKWIWRGEYTPAGQAEYQSVKRQLSYERVTDKDGLVRPYSELGVADQSRLLKNRLKSYASNVYKKTKITQQQERVDTVCMRENNFYVNTVRNFRDRRYEYKLATKSWKGKKAAAEQQGDWVARKNAEDKEILMDSLQLAHKCILNSFYGYVMRKGARWRSMEMAGIVTYTGAQLIMQARELVEQVGRPLELDTDGIWCILPASFPQDFKFKFRNGTTEKLQYPCAMLNADVHDRYTNHQYQDLQQPEANRQYRTRSECSIFFELDGPYKAMALPASPEEGKLLKKKYVVYNFDGTVAELKGFELKRRGELELVKAFQSQVFGQFLEGDSLEECYAAVGAVGNYWLDVIDAKGTHMDDEELMELISEKKTISKTIDDYEGRKATSLTTAGRLADFLGAEMVKDKGLNCNLIISRLPAGAPVTERAIPVAIFSAHADIRQKYLRKWLKDPSLDCEDFRDVVDWSYYRERLARTIQKIITIPAGMQRISNPCPRVEHPVWLQRQLDEKASGLKQTKLTSMFKKIDPNSGHPSNASMLHGSQPQAKPRLLATSAATANGSWASGGGGTCDIEDIGGSSPNTKPGVKVHGRNKRSMLLMRETDGTGNEGQGESGDGDGDGGGSPADGYSAEELHDVDGEVGGGSPHRDMSPAGATADAAALGTSLVTPPVTSSSSEGGAGLGNNPAALPPGGPGVSAKAVKALGLADSTPASLEELATWLQTRKQGWRVIRQVKRRDKLLASGQGLGQGKGRGKGLESEYGETGYQDQGRKKAVGVVDFVRNASLAAAHGYWQIIEWQATDTPGEFTVWAMTSKSQLQKLKVVVPRVLYVNCRGPGAEEAAIALNGVKIKRDLPHARPTGTLYEVAIPERKFIRNEKALALFLCDPQVEGVYESQTPLWLRAVLKTGCVARPTGAGGGSASGSSGGQRVFKLDQLDFVNTKAHPYLQPAVTASYRKIYLYCSMDRTRSSGLAAIGLFLLDSGDDAGAKQTPATAPTGRAFVWLVNPNQITLDSKPPFQRIYRRFQPDEGLLQIKFSTTFVSSSVEAYRQCGERLAHYARERHGPTVIIGQGGSLGFDPRSWRRAIPVLQDFPLITMPPNSTDDLYPAIGWSMFVAERMVQRFLIFPAWFDDRLACARHAHVPISSLGMDALTTMIDVTFARALQHNRHLLWASEGTTPDLGGAEVDQHQHGIWSDKLQEPVVNHPGAYRSVCVELDVYGLAVAAIMNSSLLDAEGLTGVAVTNGQSAKTAGGQAPSADEMMDIDGDNHGADGSHHPLNVFYASGAAVSSDASVARAFHILKAAAAKWIHDVTTRNDAISDSILTALYRYLCGYGDALLRDPTLHQVIYGLMIKLFKRLVSALKKLGTRVVYADFTRIIVHTDKEDLPSAREYIDFVLGAVCSRELFGFLEISPKTYWEQVLWLGPDNWGAILLVDNPNPSEGLDDQEDDHDDEDAVAVDADRNEDSGNGVDGNNDNNIDDAEQEWDEDQGGTTHLPGLAVAHSTPSKHKTSKHHPDGLGPGKKGSVTFAKDVLSPVGKKTVGGGGGGKNKRHQEQSKDEYAFLDTLLSKKSSTKRGKSDRNRQHDVDDDDAFDEDEDDEDEDEEEEGEQDDDDGRQGGNGNNDGSDNNGGGHGQEEDSSDPLLQAHWTLAQYLPPAAAEYFYFIVGEFLYQYRHRRHALLRVRNQQREHLLSQDDGSYQTHGLLGKTSSSSSGQAQAVSAPQLPLTDEEVHVATSDYMRQLVQQQLGTRLLKLVDELSQAYGSGGGAVGNSAHHLPMTLNSDSSHNSHSNAALEFVKAVTHILALDPALTTEVASLKRLLLAQLRVREFSVASEFQDPSLSYVLRDVICSHCSTCRDLDLLRDPSLTMPEISRRWRCAHCGNNLDTVEIEHRLLAEAERLSTVYLLQDFRCPVTKGVSTRLGASTSALCAPLQMDVTPSTLHGQLALLQRVAKYHAFPWLESTLVDLMI